MQEFNDDLLQEYLDGTLDEAARQAVEAYLAQSPKARAQLAELEVLFSSLEALPELPLNVDLSAAVVAEIGRETAASKPLPRWLWRLLLGQVLIAALLLGNVWSSLLGWWGTSQAIATDWWATAQLSFLNWLSELWVGITAVWQQPNLPNLTFDLPAAQWALLFGLALIVWLAGNRLMFTAD